MSIFDFLYLNARCPAPARIGLRGSGETVQHSIPLATRVPYRPTCKCTIVSGNSCQRKLHGSRAMIAAHMENHLKSLALDIILDVNNIGLHNDNLATV